MTRKQGNKKQTEAGGTGDVRAVTDSLARLAPYCRDLVDREAQTLLLA